MDSMYEIKLNHFKATADIIKRHYNGREVVLLGDSVMLKELLEKDYGIKVKMIATLSKEKVGKHGLIDFETIKNHSSEYYVAIPFIKNNPTIKNILVSSGYMEFKDFVFSKHPKIVLKPGFEDYHDLYGNHIHCKSGCSVILEEDVSNTTVFVDDTCSIRKSKIRVFRSGGALVFIDENCKFLDNVSFECFGNATIKIGKNTTIGGNTTITAVEGNTVEIGNDCMFSHSIQLYSGDGHAVFDTSLMKRTNSPEAKFHITIKDHVWIGFRSIILGGKNTEIGQSSIVGAGAVVKGVFPNNCAIVGNPAKIVKKNVTWNRNYLSGDIMDCGEENIALTEE